MTPKKAQLQRQVLALREIPGVPAIYRRWYELGQRAFVRFVRRTDRKMGGGVVRAIYLRRGGGRDELLPGASDLDFFLVLETLHAEREMEFLKRFWIEYHKQRVPFPFFGEVLMGDENELLNWLETPTVRSYEAGFSWRLLWGEDCLARARTPAAPDARDVFSEALKHYWDLLQPVLKLRPEQFRADLRPHDAGATHLRNAAKAAVDIFRLHAVTLGEGSRRQEFWTASRQELLECLPAAYGENLARLRNVLLLRAPLFNGAEPFEVFAGLVHTACRCLHEMAANLSELGNEPVTEGEWKVVYSAREDNKDPYSLSVRELFAERMLLRHQETIARAILSETTTHMYFPLHALPSREALAEILLDLRDVSFSFDRFSVAMPVTELTFRELERTSLLDTPFHSFAGHEEIRHAGDGKLEIRRYDGPETKIPTNMLLKTFAELSFVLRYQPLTLSYFLEKMVALVLGLRLAADHREIATDFSDTLARYGERYPLRVEHLKSKIAPYLPAKAEVEEKVWTDIFNLLDTYRTERPQRAESIRAQLEAIRRMNFELPQSKTITTDVWINLTPFLRMEMNAMKDRYFRHRPALKI